jgi:hypothetical protein
MTRTKGAKNKPHNSKWYIDELAKMGITATIENEKDVNKLPTPKDIEKPIREMQKKQKEKLTIKKPVETETIDIEKDVLVCGNPECKKILDSEYSVCPFCGVNLKWQS